MAENPANKGDRGDHREVRRVRLGAALRENLKRRKAQARGRDGKSSLVTPSMASSAASDSADDQPVAGEKETQG